MRIAPVSYCYRQSFKGVSQETNNNVNDKNENVKKVTVPEAERSDGIYVVETYVPTGFFDSTTRPEEPVAKFASYIIDQMYIKQLAERIPKSGLYINL